MIPRVVVGYSLLLLVVFLLVIDFFYDDSVNFYKRQSKLERYGIGFNARRAEFGIPLIEPDWYTENTSRVRAYKRGPFKWRIVSNPWSIQVWSDFRVPKTNSPFHKEKEILRNFESIVRETDRFEMRENDSTLLTLEISFHFLSHADSCWTATIIKTLDTADDYQVLARDIDIVAADSILNKWRLAR
jgi:hypothetical protein